MSLEPTQTVSGTPPILHQRTHKQVYPLRMETIPILESDSKATLQSNEPTQKDEEETEYFENKQSVSNLSPDLKFKRHKNKHIQGFPTLGERLDNLQDIKRPREWRISILLRQLLTTIIVEMRLQMRLQMQLRMLMQVQCPLHICLITITTIR